MKKEVGIILNQLHFSFPNGECGSIRRDVIQSDGTITPTSAGQTVDDVALHVLRPSKIVFTAIIGGCKAFIAMAIKTIGLCVTIGTLPF